MTSGPAIVVAPLYFSVSSVLSVLSVVHLYSPLTRSSAATEGRDAARGGAKRQQQRQRLPPPARRHTRRDQRAAQRKQQCRDRAQIEDACHRQAQRVAVQAGGERAAVAHRRLERDEVEFYQRAERQ